MLYIFMGIVLHIHKMIFFNTMFTTFLLINFKNLYCIFFLKGKSCRFKWLNRDGNQNRMEQESRISSLSCYFISYHIFVSFCLKLCRGFLSPSRQNKTILFPFYSQPRKRDEKFPFSPMGKGNQKSLFTLSEHMKF